jgi:hypothetical protein
MKNPLRSPAFRRWFGDSKVVDGRGKPLIVYHGTPRGGFTSFRSGRRGLFFFTADRHVASSYIGPLADELLDSDFEADPTPGVGQPPRKGVPGLYHVYLRLSNPLVFDADGRGFDEIYPEAIGLEGPDDLTVDEIAVMARQQGYDGLIVRNLYDTGLYSDYTEPSTVYVAFDPRQIKSATVQRGTYDPDSTDIRENASSVAGQHRGMDRWGQRPNGSNGGEDYRGEHGSPDPESGAPMHSVESMMPDYYEHPDWYFVNDDGLDRAAAAAIHRVRGKPYAHVEVFRAVPKGVRKINPGDWVTTVRAYAKEHLDSALNGQGRILKVVARAGSLFTAGDSHFEWGWWPDKKREDAYLRQLRTSPAWQARYGAHRPNGRQETSFTCGPAAMQTVLDSFGIYRRQSDLAHELGTTAAEGTRPDALVRCAWGEGLHAKQSRNTRFETVIAAVRHGARVILNFQAWPERGQRVGQGAQDGHYAVVQRATDEDLVLADPSSARPVLLSREDLEDRWYDVDADGHPVHRLAIFIEGEARSPVPLRQQESSTP